ncbi:hypothetical protein V2O64_13855 [Verrucomicrobiaceae bacterium 227]
MRSRYVVGVIIAICGLLVIYSNFSREVVPPKVLHGGQVGAAGREAEESTRVITRSVFNEEYASPTGTIRDDLESVLELITDCQLTIKDFDSHFLPDNQAITSFLKGGNIERIAWIPPSHAAVSGEGELLDRNNVPLFFHRKSGLRFEIRSAGEDRVMWTGDDVVYPDGASVPQDN